VNNPDSNSGGLTTLTQSPIKQYGSPAKTKNNPESQGFNRGMGVVAQDEEVRFYI